MLRAVKARSQIADKGDFAIVAKGPGLKPDSFCGLYSWG